MDYGRDGNVVQIITGGGGNENWAGDQAVWATEDDYRFWNNGEADTPTDSNYDQRQSQSRSGSEPPNKMSRKSQDATSSNRSKAIGKMFFKTKLCCKFRAGTCPYITNCNFAHSVEELRRPPPNWQEIVAAHEEEKSIMSEPREEFQIPSIVSSGFAGEMQKAYKGRHCKKFYTEEGCPYGDNCTFLHDEQSRNRESVAISLGPGGYGGAGSGSNSKPSNSKTRICNKWEMTGYCPFGNKCHFAHGAAANTAFMATEMPSSPGLVISATESIISFLSIAAKDLHLSEELQQTALNLLRQPNVPYMPLRTIWIASDPNTRPDLIQLFSRTQFVFPSPKPREKSEELKARLKKLEELAEKQAYQELVKDIALKKDVEEPFSSYKDQLGFGLHVALTMFTGYAFGYVAFRALFNHNPAMNAAGGILGLVVGMLVETFLFIIRSSNAEKNRMRSSTAANITKRFSKSSVGTSNLKKNQ